MGVYSDYLSQRLNPDQLSTERKKQLARIRERRGRDVLAFAADVQSKQPTSIAYADVLAFRDQLSGKSGPAIDIVLETPGGAGEVVEDLIMMLRTKYRSVGVIVPGVARSAGTIFAMGADEILMDGSSALGPIDAQLSHQGKTVSAQVLLDSVRRIRDEAAKTGIVNAADAMILQNVSPAELQLAEHAVAFARGLVTGWLVRYHFQAWTTHQPTGAPVTDADRQGRARAVADALCDRTRWMTHSRAITIEDLRGLGLTITDFAADVELDDAIQRYAALLQITFASGVYKVFETPDSQILREDPGAATGQKAQAKAARLTIQCHECGASVKIHAPFAPDLPVPPDALPFPASNVAACPACGRELHLAEARRQIEAQAHQTILAS